MTAAQRLLPSQNSGGTPPFDATDWQNKADIEDEALWRYVVQPLINVSGINSVTASSDTSVVQALTSYQVGMKFSLTPVNTNTGAVTINIDGVGVKNVNDQDNNAIATGNWISGRRYMLEYDGTEFRVIAAGMLAPQPPSPAPEFIIQDQKAQNTAGGGFTSGAFQTRTLNTVVRNTIAGASLSANQFTLPAGTYVIRWSCPANLVNAHQSRLQNMTDSTSTVGSSAVSNSTVTSSGLSEGIAVLTLSTSKTFEIQHRCGTTRATDGFGVPANFTTELYTRVEITTG
jgi:hypothetical protein